MVRQVFQGRVGFAVCAVVLLAVSACAAAPDAPQEASEAAVVETSYGALRGEIHADAGYVAFRGVPFAAPPVGEGRWAPPAAPESWTGVREAVAFGPACAQPATRRGGWAHDDDVVFSEDCLYLNVYAPTDALAGASEPLPVMFWIFGGGFSAGNAAQAVYRDPSAYTDRGVILVVPNYRLGALGYLAHPDFSANAASGTSGNYGTMDQIAALEWVQDNIAAFGGDPDNVTVFGESAGAISNNVLMVTPTAQGLFAKAIMQSGGIWGLTPYMKSLAEAEAWGEAFLAERGATTLAEARALETSILAELPREYAFSLQPIADGVLTPETTGDGFLRGNQSGQPFIIGWTKDEAGRFFGETSTDAEARAWFAQEFGEAGEGLFEAYYAGDGDYRSAMVAAASNGIAQGSLVQAELHLAKSENVYVFRFDLAQPTEDGERHGVVHGADVPYTFGYFPDDIAWRDADRQLSAAMIDYWVAFAKTGNPNVEGQPEWPAFDPADPVILSLGDPVQAKPLQDHDLHMRTIKTENYSRDVALRAGQ